MNAADTAVKPRGASSQLAGMLCGISVHSSLGYDLPVGLIGVWVSCGPQFQLSYNIETSEGLDDLVYWWLQHGRFTFSGLAEILDGELIFNLHFKLLTKEYIYDANITPLMEIVYRHRPDLSQLFDVGDLKGRIEFWCWWLARGSKEYSRDHSEANFQGRELLSAVLILQNTFDGYSDETFSPLRNEINALPYQALLALGSLGLRHENEVMQLIEQVHLSAVARCLEAEAATPLMRLVYNNRPDLRQAFLLDSEDPATNFWSWWIENGAREYFPPHETLVVKEIVAIVSAGDDPDNRFADAFRYRAVLKLAQKAIAESDEVVRLIEQVHLSAVARCLEAKAATPLMRLVYNNRPDLQQAFLLDSEDPATNFWSWWIENGAREYFPPHETLVVKEIVAIVSAGDDPDNRFADAFRYRAVLKLAQKAIAESDEVVRLIEQVHLSAVARCLEAKAATPLMRLVYNNRPDLRQAFLLDSEDPATNFWSWWIENGAREYFPPHETLVVKEIVAIVSAGDDPDNRFADAFRYRAVLKLAQKAITESDEIAALWNSVHFQYFDELRSEEGWTPLMGLIHRNRPDLRYAFPDGQPGSKAAFRRWWDHHSGNEYCIFRGEKPVTLVLQTDNVVDEPIKVLAPQQPVALTGYPRGEFGLGEDIRLLRASLQSIGIEPDVIRAPWQITAREGIDQQIIEADKADFAREVMIYVMPAFDTLTLLNKVGPEAFSARRRIGYWQWELSKFPEPAKMAFELVDEIWCHSEHSAQAFRSATDKPVIKVPLPVATPEFRRVPRSAFKLNDDTFIVFTSFDGASSISRKNPLAAINAFQKAFPRATHPTTQLVVKAMNALDDALWRDCVRKSYLDDRILIVNEVLDREAYYQLLSCCDAVLSMHRAEGFGRLMAEAMAIGIPVISTAYSGNLDFMNEENSWLISGEVCKLVPGDYAFYQGQEWMEPDVDEAAEALRDCYSNVEKRERFVLNARQTIAHYSPENCGLQYISLLSGSL